MSEFTILAFRQMTFPSCPFRRMKNLFQ
jgi:hypothetical protein